MAKKKDEKEQWTTVATSPELDEVKTKIESIEKTLDNFRTSFQNLETALRNLKERNRLR